MGYYTDYRLETTPEVNRDALAHRLSEIEYNSQPERAEITLWRDIIDGFYGSIKWYNHDETMLDVSTEYPSVVFKLYGNGEEHDDEWVKFYRNGESYVLHRPEWVVPAFDAARLR